MTTQTRSEQPAERALRAWQDGINAMFGGYGRQIEQFSRAFVPQEAGGGRFREVMDRIADSTREVTNAQLDVVSEWLRLPLALTSGAAGSGLTTSYGRLFEAYSRLAAAYFSAAAPMQIAVAESTQRAAETATKVIDIQAQTAREVVADNARATEAASEATAEAINGAARRTAQATSAAVEQAMEVAEHAVEQTVEATRGAAAQARKAAEPERLIKGNISARGEKIYHLPGQSSYERTQAEELFASEADAQAAGYRRAETPGGGKVKGKVTRDGERIYHLPGQANYDRVEADMLFETEEAAQAAGFRASQR